MSWVISLDGQQMVTSGHYGVRLSRDGGRSWTDLTGHLPYSDVHALGVDPGSPSHCAYAVGRGLLSSTDAGQSWSSRAGGSISLMGPILVSPGGERLVAADTSRVWRKREPGWRPHLAPPSRPAGQYAGGDERSRRQPLCRSPSRSISAGLSEHGRRGQLEPAQRLSGRAPPVARNSSSGGCSTKCTARIA